MVLTEEDLKRFDELVASESAAGSEIKTLITSFKTEPKEIEILGGKLKVLPTIPRKIRHELQKFQQIENDLEATEQHIYYIMSQICVANPYTLPQFWEFLDDKYGNVPEIMKEVFEKAYEVEQKLKKFR